MTTGPGTDPGVAADFFTAVVVTPLVAALARRIGFVDRPKADRLHVVATPYLGGLAVMLALAVGFVAAGRLVPAAGSFDLENAPPGTLLFFVALAAFLLGLVDDWRPLSPPAKLAAQVAISSIFLGAGGIGPFHAPILDGVVGLVWIVGLMNGANFLDNMDGALAGASLAAGLGLAAVAAGGGAPDLVGPAVTLSAAAAGFLLWNRPPARIFLGDAGSLMIGGFLAAASWMIAARIDSPSAWIALPLAIVYPVFDLCFVTVTRIARRQPPWIGGRDHTTHRMATWFGSRERSLGALLVIAGAGAALAGVVVRASTGTALAIAGGVALALFLLALRLARVPVR
jgi:UDP-GlcNAc:undecaprenyl-phosphate GlcNAc-1-phosphate transferase